MTAQAVHARRRPKYGDAVVERLGRYQASACVPHRARVAIGALLARREDVRRDDLGMVLHLVRELTHKRAMIETVEEAVRAAFWIADYDAKARAVAAQTS